LPVLGQTHLHQTITPARKGTTVWHTALIGHFAGSAGSPTARRRYPDCPHDLRYEPAAAMTALSWDPAETWAGALAVDLAHALAGVGYVSASPDRTWELSFRVAGWVAHAPENPDLARKTGVAVASALIDARHNRPESLAAAISALQEHFTDVFDPLIAIELQTGLAAGYAAALRERTRYEQHRIQQVVLAAYRAGEFDFRSALDDAVLGIGIADREGRILKLNRRLGHMLGVEPTTAGGRAIWDLKQPTDQPRYWAAHEQLLVGERPDFTAEKQFTRPDGTVIWARMRAGTVPDQGGSVDLLITVFEDITERREIDQQLLYQATHDSLTGRPTSALIDVS
jgi:PAS domain S-box-containing protein